MSLSLPLAHNVIEFSLDSHTVESIRVTTQTWNRDSHDLFDYEAHPVHSQQFQISGRSVDLIRRGNEVVVVPVGTECPDDSEYLASVVPDKSVGSFCLEQRDGLQVKKLWSVVKANCPRGARLSEGDQVKFGRFKLRVRQICSGSSESDDNTSCSSYHGDFTKIPDEADRTMYSPDLRVGPRPIVPALTCEDSERDPSINQLQCRICLSEGPSEGDPLLCPCECAGSIRYVHANCIGHWLRGRLGLENHKGNVFFFRPMACELCHCLYPSYYSAGGVPTPLSFLPETKTPFIVLENVGGSAPVAAWNNDSSNTSPGGLHVVRFSDDRGPLKIGRGHDCQMRVSDVSISRLHALLRIEEDGSMYLEDQESKFGTLFDELKQSRSICIPPRSSICVQSGRTLISLSLALPVGSDQDTVNDTDMIDDDLLDDEASEPPRPHTH